MLQHTGFAHHRRATQQNQFRQAFDLSMAQSVLLLKPTSTESNQTETRTQYDTDPPITGQLRDLEITRPTQVNTITTALGNWLACWQRADRNRGELIASATCRANPPQLHILILPNVIGELHL